MSNKTYIMVPWDASGELREVRRTSTAPPTPVEAEGQHASLGRLLRVIADPRSNDSHMVAAIEHIRITTISNAGSSLDLRAMGELEKRPPQVLSLKDHRHISNLESVLRVVQQSATILESNLSSLEHVGGASRGGVSAARNLLCALASALVTQSVDECTSTKTNVCVWTLQSKKRLLLLHWMLGLGREASRVVINEALAPCLSSDKANQLAVSFVIFELAQRQRRNCDTDSGSWAQLIAPLVEVVSRGSTRTVNGQKPTQLGIAALDALCAVLCISRVPGYDVHRVVDAMRLALTMFKQHKDHSPRGRWALIAADNLLSILATSDPDDLTDSSEMIMWHWNASVMWLCSRSDCILAVKKRLCGAISLTIDTMYGLTTARSGVSFSPHVFCALLRRLCSLLSMRYEFAEELTKTNMMGKLLASLGLKLADPATSVPAAEVLRLCLLGDSDSSRRMQPLLHLSKTELLGFISLVQRSVKEPHEVKVEVFTLLAEISLQFGVTTDTLLRVDDGNSTFPMNLIGQALSCYTRVYAADPGLKRHWLQQTTKTVLYILECHPFKRAREQAVGLVSKLDPVLTMKFAASKLLHEAGSAIGNQLVTLLFEEAEREKALTLELARTIIDTLCRGDLPKLTISSPQDFEKQHQHSDQRDLIGAISRSANAWCTEVTHLTRTAVITALVHKIFGSPRDSVYITWLRELSLLGWFNDAIPDIVRVIISYMKSLEGLTEELLQEESYSSAKAVEHLLFARLAPNLVLRVIPRASFYELMTTSNLLARRRIYADSGTLSLNDSIFELVDLLWKQILNPMEFKEVKMLSAELLAKLPVSTILPDVLDRLTNFLYFCGTPMAVTTTLTKNLESSGDSSFVVAKLLVYYLNLAFTDDSRPTIDELLLERSLAILLTVLSLPCPPNTTFSAEKSPLVDLQMGAIECIALLLSRSLTTGRVIMVSGGQYRVEEVLVEIILPTSSDVPVGNKLRDSLWHQWLRATRGSETVADTLSIKQLQICCSNIMLSALGKLEGSGLDSFQERILRPLLLLRMKADQPPHVLAACLQIVFSFFFKAGASLEQHDASAFEVTRNSASFVLQIMNSSRVTDDSVTLGALKLFGALIGKVSWLWASLSSDPAVAKSSVTALQQIRDSPTLSHAVRQLAQSLLEVVLIT